MVVGDVRFATSFTCERWVRGVTAEDEPSDAPFQCGQHSWKPQSPLIVGQTPNESFSTSRLAASSGQPKRRKTAVVKSSKQMKVSTFCRGCAMLGIGLSSCRGEPSSSQSRDGKALDGGRPRTFYSLRHSYASPNIDRY